MYRLELNSIELDWIQLKKKNLINSLKMADVGRC